MSSKFLSYEERVSECSLKKLTSALSSEDFHALLSLSFFEWERDDNEWSSEVEFYSKHQAYLVYHLSNGSIRFYTHDEAPTFLEEILRQEGSEEILFQIDLIAKYHQRVDTYARRKYRCGN